MCKLNDSVEDIKYFVLNYQEFVHIRNTQKIRFDVLSFKYKTRGVNYFDIRWSAGIWISDSHKSRLGFESSRQLPNQTQWEVTGSYPQHFFAPSLTGSDPMGSNGK